MQYEVSVEGLDASRTRRTPGKNKLQVGSGAGGITVYPRSALHETSVNFMLAAMALRLQVAACN